MEDDGALGIDDEFNIYEELDAEILNNDNNIEISKTAFVPPVNTVDISNSSPDETIKPANPENEIGLF